jgi:dihydroorotase
VTAPDDGGSVHLLGGRILDPGGGLDTVGELVVRAGRVVATGQGLTTPHGARRVDCRGKWVLPGFVDLHVHFREPGQEHKEDVATGSAAALAGGFTTVCCMPNTVPVNDDRTVTERILQRAREVNGVRVLPVGAITRGLAGQTLADMGDMQQAGVVAVSDDGKCVMNAGLMRRAMEYARTFGLVVVQHAEDEHLSHGGAMNEGLVSTRAGIRAQPAAAEHVIVARDLELTALTGCRYHVAHVSSARSVELVREAKRRGLPVTCEVTPHHLTLDDEACATYDTRTKCNPPLRGAADVAALRAGLADGTIDAIATDHAPHAITDKEVEFEQAAFGMIGLETALPLVLRLVDEGHLPLMRALEALTIGPARCFGLPAGTLASGAAADLTVVDPAASWTLRAEEGRSKSRNTPFDGWSLKGRAVLTMVGGAIRYEA